MTTNLTLADFKSTVVVNPIVLVDFWAALCGPCRAFGPVFDRSAAAHPDIVHAKANTADISNYPRRVFPMCDPVQCPQRGKTSWGGCGQHIDSVMPDGPRIPKVRLLCGLAGYDTTRAAPAVMLPLTGPIGPAPGEATDV